MSFAFFLEMAWKSAAIAGAALLLVTLLRSRSAADRASVLRVAVGLLLLLPLVSLLVPALQLEIVPASPEPSPVAPVVLSSAYPVDVAALASAPAPAAVDGAAMGDVVDDPGLLIALLYLGGLLMAAARLLAGLWTLGRWTGASRPVECPEWTAAFERVQAAAAAPGIRLLVCDEAQSPLSWGWLRPTILIDPDTLDRPEDADAILEHEVAHLVRRDWPALMLARAASILFWFNPLVLLLERSFVQNAEEAADCHAAQRVEPAYYAETLLGCARHACGTTVPANSIAGSDGIARRVRAILDGRLRATPSGSKWARAAMIATVAFAAPVAALELTEAKAPDAPRPPAAPAAPQASMAAAVAAAPQAPAPVAAPATPAAPEAPEEEANMTDQEMEGVARVADRALASVLPQIPAIVASAMSAIDPEEIGRIAEQATREAGHEAQRATRHAEAEALRATREALREASRSRAHGAQGMEAGARSMERGAQQMAEEARKLRTSREYREEQIAKAAARGERLTHEELIRAAGDLERGSRDMVKGAQEMREAAAEMRRQFGN